jgi:hypothetical protein
MTHAKEWNGQVAKGHQLVGVKSQAVKNVFELDDAAVDALLAGVSDMGWERCWCSEDALASKKLYPGVAMTQPACRFWKGLLCDLVETVKCWSNFYL